MRFLFLVCTLFIGVNMYAQIEYTSEKHKVTIADEKVVEQISKNGKIKNTYGAIISINYTALEHISDVELIYTSKKTKKVKEKSFTKTSLNSSSFFAGKNALQYKVNEAASFHLNYTNTQKDLMFFSTLDFYTYNKCDSISYELNVPSNYQLNYDVPFEIENLEIDSIISATSKKYTFLLYQNNTKPLREIKQSDSPYIVQNNLFKVVRISLSKNQLPQQVLNKWYQNLTLSVGVLNDNSKLIIDSIAKPKSQEVENLFMYVQQKIRYLDIEDGISAFKPRDVNDILTKKQGDCKDMANLLTQALVYKGYEAHMALSSSLSHRLALDFPNIASANHVVCVVKLEGEWVVLDATDTYCLFLNPSSHTQNQQIFIIGDALGIFTKVKTIPYGQNLDSTYCETTVNDGLISSVINVHKKGLSNRNIYVLKKRFTDEKFNEWISTYIKTAYPSYKISDLEVDVAKNKSSIKFNTIQKTKTIISIKNKNYLAINKLVLLPYNYPEKIKTDEKLITYETIYKKDNIKVNFDGNISLLNEMNENFKATDFSFDFSVHQLNSKSIEIKYVLIIDRVEVEGEAISVYNKMNELITACINKSIIYETLEK